MESITSVTRVEQLANAAATRKDSAEQACPYPPDSAAGKLFLLMFEIEQKRLEALAESLNALGAPGQPAIKTGVKLEHVHEEARLAAAKFDSIDDACPYPFASDAGRLFKEFFQQAKEHALPPTPQGLRGSYIRVWSKA